MVSLYYNSPLVMPSTKYDRLISTMGFLIQVRCHLYIITVPWLCHLQNRHHCLFFSRTMPTPCITAMLNSDRKCRQTSTHGLIYLESMSANKGLTLAMPGMGYLRQIRSIHACWYPDSCHHQAISSHGIDCVSLACSYNLWCGVLMTCSISFLGNNLKWK